MSRCKIFVHTDLDGVGCAILAYLAFGRENVDVEYCDYSNVDEKVMEWFENNTIPYKHIFITDISINEKMAVEIDSRSWREKVLLFDHHATALGLNKYDWCDVRVTNDTGVKTSGTELFYIHLYTYGAFNRINRNIQGNIKRFVEIVRDYDTWRWKEELGEEGIVCKRVNDLFYIYGRDEFITWAIDKITLCGSFPKFDPADAIVLTQNQKDIDIYVEQKGKQLVIFHDQINGITEGVVFAERYFSELGNRLCEMHPELDYVAIIDICNGKVSYRTTRDDINLGGEIAHSFVGGGHKKAAGSTFDSKLIQKQIMSKIFGFTVE